MLSSYLGVYTLNVGRCSQATANICSQSNWKRCPCYRTSKSSIRYIQQRGIIVCMLSCMEHVYVLHFAWRTNHLCSTCYDALSRCKWTQICKKRNSKSKFIPQLNSRLVRLVPSSLTLIYTCMKINVLVNILKPGESGLKNIPCIWLFMLQSHDFHVLFFASFQ